MAGNAQKKQSQQAGENYEGDEIDQDKDQDQDKGQNVGHKDGPEIIDTGGIGLEGQIEDLSDKEIAATVKETNSSTLTNHSRSGKGSFLPLKKSSTQSKLKRPAAEGDELLLELDTQSAEAARKSKLEEERKKYEQELKIKKEFERKELLKQQNIERQQQQEKKLQEERELAEQEKIASQKKKQLQDSLFQQYSPPLYHKISLLIAGLYGGHLAMEHYDRLDPFLEYGSEESWTIVLGVLGVGLVLGHILFQKLVDRCTLNRHLFLLATIPLVCVSITLDLYEEQKGEQIVFESWYEEHHQALALFHQLKYKESKKHFALAAAFVDKEKEYRHILLTSHIFITHIELLEGKKKEALQNFMRIFKEYPKRASLPILLTSHGISQVMTEFGKFDQSEPYFTRCLDVAGEMQLKPPLSLFKNDCMFDKAKALLADGDVKAALPIISDNFEYWEKLSGNWLSASLQGMFEIANYLFDVKLFDLSLEYYLRLLDKTRGLKEKKYIGEVYEKLVLIYKEKGEVVKSEIYRVNREELLKNGKN